MTFVEGVGKSTIVTSLIKESFVSHVSLVSQLCGKEPDVLKVVGNRSNTSYRK
jgi:hypothetical protein